MSDTIPQEGAAPVEKNPGQRRGKRRKSSLFARGEPMVWLTGGSLVICLVMILGLLGLVLANGLGTFWPSSVERIELLNGEVHMGEISKEENFIPQWTSFAKVPEDRLDAVRSKYFHIPEDPAEKKKFYDLVAQGMQPQSRGVEAHRRMYRTGNYRLTNVHFNWVTDYEIKEGGETRPEWVVVVERLQWGRFYGVPHSFRVQKKDAEGKLIDEFDVVAEGPEATWAKFEEVHDTLVERRDEIKDLEKHDLGEISHDFDELRLDIRRAELDEDEEGVRLAKRMQAIHAKRTVDLETEVASARGSLEQLKSSGATAEEIKAAETTLRDAEWAVSVAKQTEGGTLRDRENALKEQIRELRHENERYHMAFLVTSQSEPTELIAGEIVRAYPANRLGTGEKIGTYLSRWGEYLTDDPREANSEGGVWPAIFGTVIMTLIMSIMVVPFGVLAALYLREYAKQGTLVSIVRIAVNNLAGVPSIVFGVFGLGFFCYVIGAGIDDLFFAEKLPQPTFGTGGLLWASLTLALLTLPVVIVATEEALAAVPNSMREGSYACGASKWQTIRRIVLPRAAPGIMTGMILAVARGAGEVAPLMLVGAVKLAPELPIDGTAPFIHAERSFMHLGFHIYDLGFQSQNSEAAKPMVFTTTLLLITIVVSLNILAIWVRARLRKAHSA